MIKYYLTPKAIRAGCKFEQPRQGDAAYDIYAAESVTIEPSESVWVDTGLFVRIPSTGLYPRVGIIKDRSGFAGDKGLFTHAGVIDSGYTGEIKILMENSHSNILYDESIKAGDKIAQMIIVQHLSWPTERVSLIDDLGRTVRGSDGFGSTGI